MWTFNTLPGYQEVLIQINSPEPKKILFRETIPLQWTSKERRTYSRHKGQDKPLRSFCIVLEARLWPRGPGGHWWDPGGWSHLSRGQNKAHQVHNRVNYVGMRSSRVVRASDCQCQSRNSLWFDSASSDTEESEGQQMKQCWIKYIKQIQKIPTF